MTFSDTYNSVRQLLSAGQILEAVHVYMELLKSDREQVLDLVNSDWKAQERHYEVARRYAIQKILIQRLRSEETINLDLSLFSTHVPLRIKYDEAVCKALAGWKEGTHTFDHSRILYKTACQQILERNGNAASLPYTPDADIYFAIWVIGDFIELERIPFDAGERAYISLGCGSGMLDSILIPNFPTLPDCYFIDIDSAVLDGAVAVAACNGIENARFQTGWSARDLPPATIISIRSCAYLYSVQEYASLFQSLRSGSRVFMTVSPVYRSETQKFFKSLGATERVFGRTRTDADLLEYAVP